MKKAYKYRLNPNKQQRELLERYFGCTRYVYNWALGRKKEAYENDKTSLSYEDLCKELTQLKKEEDKEWLAEAPAQQLQQAIRNMSAAYQRFFREKKGYPKFKSKKFSKQSLNYPQKVRIDFENHRLTFPKIGDVKFFKNRTFDGTVKTVTLSKTPTGKYFAAVLVEDNTELPTKAPITVETAVGIDVGIKDFAVLSNGQVFANPKYLEKAEKRLKVLQRRLSKKQKGSNRREKARKAVAKQHEIVSNSRANFLHQVTSMIIRENQTVVIEDLNVEGMRKNHQLAKPISSASWHEFFRQLQYKCEWNGKNLIRIGRFEPSSKTCVCGHIYKELKLSERTWRCPECGTVNDRDLLAANNIKRFGLQQRLSHTKTSPAVSGVELVEQPAIVGAMKREYVQV